MTSLSDKIIEWIDKQWEDHIDIAHESDRLCKCHYRIGLHNMAHHLITSQSDDISDGRMLEVASLRNMGMKYKGLEERYQKLEKERDQWSGWAYGLDEKLRQARNEVSDLSGDESHRLAAMKDYDSYRESFEKFKDGIDG